MSGQDFQTLVQVRLRLTKPISCVIFFSPHFLIFLFSQLDPSNQGRQAAAYLILKDSSQVLQVFCTFQRSLLALASALPTLVFAKPS